jgi:hypothetical protein
MRWYGVPLSIAVPVRKTNTNPHENPIKMHAKGRCLFSNALFGVRTSISNSEEPIPLLRDEISSPGICKNSSTLRGSSRNSSISHCHSTSYSGNRRIAMASKIAGRFIFEHWHDICKNNPMVWNYRLSARSNAGALISEWSGIGEMSDEKLNKSANGNTCKCSQ